MSMTEQEQIPKKKKLKVYSSLEEVAEDVKKIDAKYLELVKAADSKKKDIIRKYADDLYENGQLNPRDVSTHMAEKLKGFATRRWITECLPDKYKDAEQQRRRGAGGSSSTRGKKCPHCGLYPNQKKHEDGSGDSDQLFQIDITQFKEEDIDAYDLKTMRVFLHDIAPYLKPIIREIKKGQ